MSSNAQARKFFDPLYDVVTFQERYWDKTSGDFPKIIQTHEFNRLNFIKQEGFTWLEFPSATHTRYSAALGCWHLADLAVDNIPVITDEGKSYRLSKYLGDWLEEFRLAVLLHDVGHFPFTLTIETNDELKQKFREQEGVAQGVELIHEDFGIAMVCDDKRAGDLLAPNTNQSRIHRLYKDYKDYFRGHCPTSECHENFVASQLTDLQGVDVDKLVYFLDPNRDRKVKRTTDPNRPSDFPDLNEDFLRQAQQLIIGTVDLGHLDRFARVAYNVTGRSGELPVRAFIHNLAIASIEGRFRFQVWEEFLSPTYRMLFDAKQSITDYVLHNEKRLAYETMLNQAINLHWNTKVTEETEMFRKYLPFLDDYELIRHLSVSDNQKVRDIIRCIHRREPYQCLGRFRLNDQAYAALTSQGDRSESDQQGAKASRDEIQTLRRISLSKRLQDAELLGQDCLIRLTKSFGSPGRKEMSAREDSQVENRLDSSPIWCGREDWMDLNDLYTRTADSVGDQRWERLSKVSAHKDSADVITKHGDQQRRSFWLFTPLTSEGEVKKQRIKALDIVKQIGGERV